MIKFLTFDLETLPCTGLFWRPGNIYVSSDNVLEDTSVLCVGYSYLDIKDRSYDAPKVLSVSASQIRKDPYNDLELLEKVYEVIERADVLVGHNMKRFDIKVLYGRFLVHGFPPLPPKPIVDTLSVLHKHFRLPSHSLDAACRSLGLGAKKEIPFSAWKALVNKDVKPLSQMKEYCAHDVELTAELYYAVRPWMTTHPSMNLVEGIKDACPRCGAQHSLVTNPSWVHYARTRSYPRFKCTSCGSWSVGVRSLGKVEVK